MISKVWKKWRYVSIYGGVLSLFEKFSISKKVKFVRFHTLGKKKTGKFGRLKNCEKKMSKIGKKTLR